MGHSFRLALLVCCSVAGVAAGSGPDRSPRQAYLAHDATRFIAQSGWNGVTLYRTADGSVGQRFAAPARVDRFAVSPDERYLLAGGEGGTLTLWRVATGDRVWAKPRGEAGLLYAAGLAFAGDGERFAVCDIEERVIVFDTRTGNEVGRIRLPNPMARAASVALDHDGSNGFLVVEGRGLYRFDTATSRLADLHLSAGWPMQHSADGKYVTFPVSREAGVDQLAFVSMGDPPTKRPLGKFGSVGHVRPMPDGSFLVTDDAGPRVEPRYAGTQLWPDGRIRDLWKLDRRQGVNELTDFLPEPLIGVSTDSMLVTTVTDLRTGQVVTRVDNSANRSVGRDPEPVTPERRLELLMECGAAAVLAGVGWLVWRHRRSRPGRSQIAT